MEAWQSDAMSHQQPMPLRLPDAASTEDWLRHRFPAQLDDARELAEELGLLAGWLGLDGVDGFSTRG